VRNPIARGYEEDAATLMTMIARMLERIETLERIQERAKAYGVDKLALPLARTFGETR
jgi:hypothetical protein